MILYLHHIQIAVGIDRHIKGVVHLVRLKTITSETGQQIPLRAEFLDRMRSVLDHVNVVIFIGRDTDWMIEMLAAGAQAAPLRQETAVAVELLDQVIVVVDNINVAFTVGRHIKRQAKPAVARARTPPLALINEIAGRAGLIEKIALLQSRQVIPAKRDTARACFCYRRLF